jgi:hypothetical protein
MKVSDERGISFFETLARDVAYALRTFRRAPLVASDLYVIQRRSLHDAWGPPGKVDALSSVGDDNAITFSNDGRLIFFGSDRPGGCRGTDIWSARRTNPHDDFVWEAPVNLGCTINSSQDDDGPTYFEAPSGEKALIFCSFNRPSAVAAGFGDWDIYEVRGADFPAFGAATLVASVSSKARDTRTALRSDGLELLFTSSRPGSLGKKDSGARSARASTRTGPPRST